MSDVVIRVEDLGKQYRIGRELRYRTLRETLNDWAAAPFRWLRRGGPAAAPETIWALRHVNLEVKRGEVVGIIGRNGAGKSTLLKILARITEPTEGRVELVGRVGSLLEVGTGFHPELTGRENIFLNGALLGMTRREIQRKFDEIVAFAEIDQFLDTPVKHYSSGMYMRLAFAVAAHLEPEILIVDEVLAVGDAAFQKKCMGKMGAVAREGRTVLFVSHNLTAVRKVCKKAMVLECGRKTYEDTAAKACQYYSDSVAGPIDSASAYSFTCQSPDLALRKVALAKLSLNYGESLTICTEWESAGHLQVGIECSIRDCQQTPLVYYGSGTLEGREILFTPGLNTVTIEFPSLPLAQGKYFIDIGASRTAQFFYVLAESVVDFVIGHSDPLQTGYWFEQGRGSMFLPCRLHSPCEKVPVGLPQ